MTSKNTVFNSDIIDNESSCHLSLCSFPHSWLRKQMYSINQTKTKRYSLHIHALVSPFSEQSFLIVSLCFKKQHCALTF